MDNLFSELSVPDMDTDLDVKEKSCGCNGDLLSDFVREAKLQAKALAILAGLDKENAALCNQLNDELLQCKEAISTLKNMLEMQKQELAEQKAFTTRIEDLNSYLDYMENNIPEHFTYIPQEDIVENDTPLSCDGNGDDDIDSYDNPSSTASPNSISPKQLFANSFTQSPMGNGIPFSSPFVESKEIYEMQTPIQDHTLLKSARKVTENTLCPTVAYLTQEEFDSIPSYMKGRTRLTYTTVNLFIDTFNTALNKKYKIVSQPASSLRLQDKQLHLKYKKQENHETKGFYFITEEDIRNSGHLKAAITTVNSLMSILRSCRRMHEVRGQGIVRFVVNTSEH